MDQQRRRKEVTSELLSKVLLAALSSAQIHFTYDPAGSLFEEIQWAQKIIHIYRGDNVMSKKSARQCVTFLHRSNLGGNDA